MRIPFFISTLLRFLFEKNMKSGKSLNNKFIILSSWCRFQYFNQYFKTAMDTVGAGWQSESQADCIVFFGVPPTSRKKIASALPRYRCAFAYPHTPWFKQCGFLTLRRPKAVFELKTNGDDPIPHHTRLFLKHNQIPVFVSRTTSLLRNNAANIHINFLQPYFPVVLFGKNWEAQTSSLHDVVLCCCATYEVMMYCSQVISNSKLAFCLPDQIGRDQLETFLDDFSVKKVVALGEVMLPEPLKAALAARHLTVEPLTADEVMDIVLEPCFEPCQEEKDKPSAVLLNDACLGRFVPQLATFKLFRLRGEHSIYYLRLLTGNTLIWAGEGIPDYVREFAEENSVPLFLVSETMLSRYGYRKNFSTPLFEELRPASTEYSLEARMVGLATSPELDDPGLLARAAAFRERLLTLQQWLVNKDDDDSPDRPAPPQEPFVLAIWEDDGEATDRERMDFFEAVAQREQIKKLFCLVLKNGSAVSLYETLNFLLKQRCFFLRHPKDVDILLSRADAVHVHTSTIGFEAVLAGGRVVTYGSPWYAGWGLTEDVHPVQRPRSLSLDQLTALAFFCGVDYITPYSGERLSPEEALALWYMRQRPDFSRVFEGLQGRLGCDPRFLVLDLRANYYDEPERDEKLAELLAASIFGSVLADLLMLRMRSPHYRDLLELLPQDQAIEAFNIFNIQAYYGANYELIHYLMQESCAWFSTQDMTSQNAITFYNRYFDAVIRNRFHDSSIPEFNSDYTDFKTNEEKHLIYAKIMIYCFAYENFETFLNSSPDFSSIFYLEILKYLYTNSKDVIKETNIKKRIALRFRILNKYMSIRRLEGKKEFPKEFIQFLFASLREDRKRMENFSRHLESLCADKNFLPDDAHDLTFMIVDMLASNAETVLARTILDKVSIGNKSLLQKYAALGNSAASLGKRVTFDVRAAEIAASCAKTKENIKKSVTYAQRALRSNNYALLRHYQKTADIICRATPPQKPKGIIFFGYYGSFFTATLPVVFHCLVERGYAVYPIFNKHIALPLLEHSPFAKFAYALPDDGGPLRLKWTINFEEKRISALGINLYERFFEVIAMMLRRYDFDWRMPDAQRLFHYYLKQTDSTLYWCDQLYKTANRMASFPTIGIVSMFAYQLPEAAMFDYVSSRGNEAFRFIQFKNAANFDLVHKGSEISTQISAFDMGLYPDCRLSFLPGRSRFEPWYQARRGDAEFCRRLEEIKEELRRGAESSSGSLLERLRSEKAAGKRIVCCIGRLLFDKALRKDGGPGHEDMVDWLRHSVEVTAETPDLLLLVRPHPHEYNSMASVRARQTIRDILPAKLPDNVLYLDPNEMKVQALIGLMDLAVLWLGTAAHELTALGVPVAICSWAGYDQSPYNAIYPQNREAYARLLKEKTYPVPDSESQDRAAACLEYIRSSGIKQDYSYAYVRESNSFRIIPYYHEDQLEKYFAGGDARIEAVADQIVEGFGR